MKTGKDQIALAIKVVRISTGFLLVCALFPLSFLYPFLFAEPNPLVVFTATLLLSVAPFLFFFTSRRMKVAILNGDILQGSFYTFLPLFGLGVVIVGWSPILTSLPDLSSYGPIKGANGATLTIQPPQDCGVADHHFRGPWPNANYNGVWHFQNGATSFRCTAPTGEVLNISSSNELPRLDSENENNRTVYEQGKVFEIHNARWEKGPIFEVINFEGDDGKPVSVKHNLSELDMYFVDRNLDDSFQISYSVKVAAKAYTRLVEVDGQILQYVKTISKRN